MAEIDLVKSPRLCLMLKEGGGYGFNLHGEKGVVGQYISAVDKDSAASRAGLSVGDRVIEVNGVNVETATHAQVVAKIKENPVQAQLLVVDRITDQYLQREGISITAELSKYETVLKLNQPLTNGVIEKGEPGFHADVDKLSRSSFESKEKGELNPSDNIVMSRVGHHSAEVVLTIPPPPAREDRLEIREAPEESEDHFFEEKNARHGGSITSDDSAHLSESDHSRRLSNDSSSSSPNPDKRSRISFIPKRKQVKEQKSDWRAKAALFDSL